MRALLGVEARGVRAPALGRGAEDRLDGSAVAGVERDLQFWIDVLVREGKLKEGQLSASEILYSPETASN